MGCVATAVTNSLKENTVQVGEGKDEDEYIITMVDVSPYKHCQWQESRKAKEEVEDNWLRLNNDVDLILNQREGALLNGDFNAAVGNSDRGIKENRDKVSYSLYNISKAATAGEWGVPY